MHDEGNVLSGLAEAVRGSVQGIGAGLRAGAAAVSAMLGMPAGQALPGSSSSGSWPGEAVLAGGMASNVGGMGRAGGSNEGELSIAAALAAAGFGGGAAAAAAAALGRSSSGNSAASAATAVPASSCSGSSAGGWPAGLNASRLSNSSGASHSRNSSVSNVPRMMQHGLPVQHAVGGGASAGPLQALLMQLPLVQGGDSYSSPLAAHRY